MKKLNYLLVTALAVLTMAACGSKVEPAPEPAPAPAPVNTTNQQTTQPTNTNEGFVEENQGNANNMPNPEDIILPQEYSVLIVGHRWVRFFDSALDDYLEFYDDGTWAEYEYDYDVSTWMEEDYGFVDFNYDDPQYVLYSNNTGLQVEAVRYDEQGYLNSTMNDVSYAQDAQMPSDLLNYDEHMDSDYFEYIGTWYEVWPDGTYNSCYVIGADGTWSHYTDDVMDNTGYITISGNKISFYGDDGNYLCFTGTVTDNVDLIDCPGFELERW